MITLERYSEPYSPTGGLAAEGVLNQLGRPDSEPLEVLVREAVQNCWDARRPAEAGIRVEIARRTLDARQVAVIRDRLLVDAPPALPLAGELRPGMQTLAFADFGTAGLGGPTRADRAGGDRDFADFVRNIGQPPDKELGGGSYGYGKAAFYIASRARTILIDTLCALPDGGVERRFIGCALGDNFEVDGRPYTGRHWWGRVVDGVPEPLVGEEAEAASLMLDLPDRQGPDGLGTTVVVVAPGVTPEVEDGSDPTMEFLAEALIWNFWPRMIDTRGGTPRTMRFALTDDEVRLRIPNPRTHERLRGFVEAMDRLHEEPGPDDEFLLDRSVECLRPIRTLGRLVVQKGPVAPAMLPDRPVPQGARLTASSVHHVALMRNAELVVKYLPGAAPVVGRLGYSGVFRCTTDVDDAFRRAEPPTHDDWIHRSVPPGHDRTFVKVASERIAGVCREAAGFDPTMSAAGAGEAVPLGEFADALATLIPGFDGSGARRAPGRRQTVGKARPKAPGRSVVDEARAGVWVEGEGSPSGASSRDPGSASDFPATEATAPDGSSLPPVARPPQARSAGDPHPAIASDGSPVVQYPIELRAHGSRLRVTAHVEVMTNDGAQVETDAPSGYQPPQVHAWVGPDGAEHQGGDLLVGPEGVDGRWIVEIPIQEEAMMRVDITPMIE